MEEFDYTKELTTQYFIQFFFRGMEGKALTDYFIQNSELIEILLSVAVNTDVLN